MKIHEGQFIKMDNAGKTKSSGGPGGDDFQKIMDQVASGQNAAKSDSLQSSNAVPNMEAVLNMNRMAPVNMMPVSQEKRELLDSLNDTLNLIDFYAGRLGDKNIPAKDLESLVEQLDNRLESLRVIGEGSSVPEALRPVISDMTLTIGAEIEKFRRGDYA